MTRLTTRAERAIELEALLAEAKRDAESSIGEARRDAEALRGEVDVARGDVDQALEALGAVQLELARCKGELEGKGEGVDGLAELLEEERAQAVSLGRELDALRVAAGRAEAEREAREAEADLKIAELQAGLGAGDAMITELQALVSEKDVKMEQLVLKLACSFEEAAALRESERGLMEKIEAVRCAFKNGCVHE